MIAERVGSLERSVGEIAAMLADVHRFLMTESLRCHISVPKAVAVDAAILDKIVAAVERTPFVVVEHAWVIVHPPYPYGTSDVDTSISVYLKLKGGVVAGQVSPSMTEHLAGALGITCSRMQPNAWVATSLENLDSVCSGGISGKPTVYEKRMVRC